MWIFTIIRTCRRSDSLRQIEYNREHQFTKAWRSSSARESLGKAPWFRVISFDRIIPYTEYSTDYEISQAPHTVTKQYNTIKFSYRLLGWDSNPFHILTLPLYFVYMCQRHTYLFFIFTNPMTIRRVKKHLVYHQRQYFIPHDNLFLFFTT